jgi:hypothetical protein
VLAGPIAEVRVLVCKRSLVGSLLLKVQALIQGQGGGFLVITLEISIVGHLGEVQRPRNRGVSKGCISLGRPPAVHGIVY